MNIDYIGKWGSFYLFAASSLIYIYLFFQGLRQSQSGNTHVHQLQAQLCFLYLFIALQMVIGLIYVLKINPPVAAAHVGFSGLTMLITSIIFYIKGFSTGRLIAMQILLPLLGFMFLALHIIY